MLTRSALFATLLIFFAACDSTTFHTGANTPAPTSSGSQSKTSDSSQNGQVNSGSTTPSTTSGTTSTTSTSTDTSTNTQTNTSTSTSTNTSTTTSTSTSTNTGTTTNTSTSTTTTTSTNTTTTTTTNTSTNTTTTTSTSTSTNTTTTTSTSTNTTTSTNTCATLTPILSGVISLDPSAPQAILNSGGGNLAVSKAGIMDNSSSAIALSVTGKGSIYSTAYAVVGNYTVGTGGGNLLNSSGQFDSSIISTGIAAFLDPLRILVRPDPSTMTVQSSSALSMSGSSPFTLSPGVYTGGITITGATVAFNSGVYYVDGPFYVGGSALITGSGVTIYTTPTGNGITITGSSSINLSPPTSGTYQGITFFHDNTSTVSITGSGGLNLSGTIYAPNAAVTLTGSGSVSGTSGNSAGSQIISKTLSMSGPGDMGVTWDASLAPSGCQ